MTTAKTFKCVVSNTDTLTTSYATSMRDGVHLEMHGCGNNANIILDKRQVKQLRKALKKYMKQNGH